MKTLAAALAALALGACTWGGAPHPDGGGGGGGAGGSDAGATPWPPELVSVQAQVSGRTGRDLRVSFKGKDRNLDIIAAWVRTLDAQGLPVVALDGNRDGVADASEGLVTLEPPKFVGEALTGSAVLRGFFDKGAGAGVAKLAVLLVDAASLRSGELLTPVLPQAVRPMGSGCDPLFALDRCASGLGCRGAPPTCQEGQAPQINRLGFYRAAGGPTILLEGSEPEDDLSRIRFEFQNAAGQAISIDSDGDGTPDLLNFNLEAGDVAREGAFFLRMQAGEGLDTQVGKLVATPFDLAGHQGAAKVAAPMAVPLRGATQSCDPRGFDACAGGFACSPGLVGQANRCEAAPSLRAAQCKDAPVLVATAAGARAVGRAEGASLWDTPAGCSTNDPLGRPEGVITVRLTERANKLTLSTANPGTTFDTALYFLPGCPNDALGSFGCSDDAPGQGGASVLVLQDLPAGDYLLVVDSFDFLGGTFELWAKTE